MKSIRPLLHRARTAVSFEPLERRDLFAAFTPGGFDPSFDFDGKVTATSKFGPISATDVVVQPDGRTVVVGRLLGSAQDAFAIARFNFDGSPDRFFGRSDTPGMQFVHVGSTGIHDESATAVTMQPDGKIVVAGFAKMPQSFESDDRDFVVLRLLTNGQFDRSFDGDGVQTIHFHDHAEARDVVIQKDGKIVVAGTDTDGDSDFAVTRLNPNGKLDTSFNDGGKKTIGFGGDDFGAALAIDNTGTASSNPNFGKIIVVGESDAINGDPHVAVARLNVNGTKDTSFGDGGTKITALGRHDSSHAASILMQSGGKFVIAGYADTDLGSKTANDALLMRFLPNGSLDGSFGPNGGGFSEIAVFVGDDRATHVVENLDGELIVSGSITGVLAGQSSGAIFKCTSRAPLKSGFGQAGSGRILRGVAGPVAVAQGPGRRITAAGGLGFATDRYFDDFANSIDLAIVDRNAGEQGPDTATLSISRSELLPVPTRVIVTVGGSAVAPMSTATSQIDYDLPGALFVPTGSRGGATSFSPDSIVVVIPAGQTSATITITPRDDLRSEQIETATFTIQPNPAYVIGGNASASVTIFDNDQVIASNPPIVRAARAARLKLASLFSEDRIAELF